MINKPIDSKSKWAVGSSKNKRSGLLANAPINASFVTHRLKVGVPVCSCGAKLGLLKPVLHRAVIKPGHKNSK